MNPVVKASLAPGSRVVSDYLQRTGLQPFLDKLGFNLVGYGCTTCIGNSGPLAAAVEDAINKYDLVAASVLSGNRNFEARVHQSIKANFLMSPPLVVAFALAGRVDIDLDNEPLGSGKDGKPVFLRDIWPSLREIRDLMQAALQPEVFRKLYRDFASQNHQGHVLVAILHGRVVDTHHGAVGQVPRDASLGAGRQVVANPNIGKRAACHHAVVAAPRTVAVEIIRCHAMFHEILASRRRFLD